MMPNPAQPLHSRRASRLGLAAALLLTASCIQQAPAMALDPGKVASITVGRSSRADVFAALGQPGRTERSALGEAWVYDAKPTGPGLMRGATAASGMIGTFVPYAGLVGSGLGLAGASMGTPGVESSLTVTFRADGVVRDCAYASTAQPAGMPGSAGAALPVDCQRP